MKSIETILARSGSGIVTMRVRVEGRRRARASHARAYAIHQNGVVTRCAVGIVADVPM